MKIYALLICATLLLLPAADGAEKKQSFISGKLTLDRAVKIALEQNPDILRARQEIERTRGLVVEVRAEALPSVGVGASYRQEDKYFLEQQDGSISPGPGSPEISFSDLAGQGGDKTWRITMEARQILYSGGRVKAAQKIAKYTEDESYHMLRETVGTVIANVRTQFYLVLLNRELITVAEESIRLLEDELRDQRNRFDAGTVPRFNVLRAEVALANSKPELIRSRNDMLIAELALAKTLGLDASTSPTGKPAFDVTGELRAPNRRLSLQNALASARSRRPLLKAQKQVILSEEQQVIVAGAGNKPQVEANGGWEFRNSRVTDDTSREVNGWFFGITGRWNVWDGGATRGRVAQAKARLETARVNLADSMHQVELEVQRAYARVQEAKELIASQGKVVEQAEEALRLARERFAAGAGTQLEVLDADFARTRAKTTEQRALFEFNSAIAEFDRATGADTIYDNTFTDPRAVRKTKQAQAVRSFRKTNAVLREE